MSEKTNEAADEANRHDWNRCPRCKNLVDADDVHDGSEVRCHGCNIALVCTAMTDESWMLVEAEEPPSDPLGSYRTKASPEQRAACLHPPDDRQPLSGDGWLCDLCGADCAPPEAASEELTDERLDDVEHKARIAHGDVQLSALGRKTIAVAVLSLAAEVRRLRALGSDGRPSAEAVREQARAIATAYDLAASWLTPRLNMEAREDWADLTREQRDRDRAVFRIWSAATRDLCKAFGIEEPRPDGPDAERACALLERGERRRREELGLGSMRALADAGDPLACALANAPVDDEPLADEEHVAIEHVESWQCVPHAQVQQQLLDRAKVEHDELRAEIERLRERDAEWQLATGCDDPETLGSPNDTRELTDAQRPTLAAEQVWIDARGDEVRIDADREAAYQGALVARVPSGTLEFVEGDSAPVGWSLLSDAGAGS